MKKFEELQITVVNKRKFVEMVEYILRCPNPEFLEELRETEFINTFNFDHQVTQNIRNKFHLWENEWVPQLVNNGYDCSPDHPDNLSMSVLKIAQEWLIERNQWYSVEEFLPIPYVYVLVSEKWSSEPQLACLCKRKNGDNVWWEESTQNLSINGDATSESTIDDVTHWRPCPWYPNGDTF